MNNTLAFLAVAFIAAIAVAGLVLASLAYHRAQQAAGTIVRVEKKAATDGAGDANKDSFDKNFDKTVVLTKGWEHVDNSDGRLVFKLIPTPLSTKSHQFVAKIDFSVRYTGKGDATTLSFFHNLHGAYAASDADVEVIKHVKVSFYEQKTGRQGLLGSGGSVLMKATIAKTRDGTAEFAIAKVQPTDSAIGLSVNGVYIFSAEIDVHYNAKGS